MLGQFHLPCGCTLYNPTTALPSSCKLCQTPMWPKPLVCVFRRMHSAETLERLAVRRHQKCLELLTCSVCEVRAGPDNFARKDEAATMGPFKEASVLDVCAPCRDGQLPTHLGSAGGCPAIFYQSELCRCTKPADATGGNTPAEAAFCWVRLAGEPVCAVALQLARLLNCCAPAAVTCRHH